jgi:defect-in-organelle-trafficking protein DotC
VTAQSDGSEQFSTPGNGEQPPSLGDLESFAPANNSSNAKEQARLQMVQQAALAYGLQGGLAHGIAQIDGIVRSRSDYLTRTYDFGALMIDGPYGTKILPPVIVESDAIYDQVDPNTVVIADHSYQILTPATFAPVQPLWQTYLIMPWTAPATPDLKDYPDNAIEHSTWDAALKKGYAIGVNQAFSDFQINLNRLNREYVGMIRWSRLVATGEATAPIVTAEMRAVVGGGEKVTIDEGKVQIVGNAQLLPRAD